MATSSSRQPGADARRRTGQRYRDRYCDFRCQGCRRRLGGRHRWFPRRPNLRAFSGGRTRRIAQFGRRACATVGPASASCLPVGGDEIVERPPDVNVEVCQASSSSAILRKSRRMIFPGRFRAGRRTFKIAVRRGDNADPCGRWARKVLTSRRSQAISIIAVMPWPPMSPRIARRQQLQDFHGWRVRIRPPTAHTMAADDDVITQPMIGVIIIGMRRQLSPMNRPWSRNGHQRSGHPWAVHIGRHRSVMHGCRRRPFQHRRHHRPAAVDAENSPVHLQVGRAGQRRRGSPAPVSVTTAVCRRSEPCRCRRRSYHSRLQDWSTTDRPAAPHCAMS